MLLSGCLIASYYAESGNSLNILEPLSGSVTLSVVKRHLCCTITDLVTMTAGGRMGREIVDPIA